MALINCPECGKEISDKAVSCPNCGCPITSSQEKTDDSKVIETNNKIEKSQSVQSKKIVSIVSVAIAVVAIIVIAIFVGKNISKKKAQEKKDQQIREVKNAMDNVDSSLGDLFTAMVPDEPFLYGDSSSDTYKNKITGILNTITENQKIVEDAYKNEDRDFIKELDDYIATNKTYRSWDEYNEEIKKIYGDSISNEQAADSLVKEMASSKEEYRKFVNHGFVLKYRDKRDTVYYDFDINTVFDVKEDLNETTRKDVPGKYEYNLNDKYEIVIMYLGNDNPKYFKGNIKLLGTNGQVIAEEMYELTEDARVTLYSTADNAYLDYSNIRRNGFKNGDLADFYISKMYSNLKDTPTDLVLELISDTE